MKKVITLVLTVVLVLAMAVPAFAVGSPTAPVADEDKTAALPEIVGSTTCSFYSIFDADELSETVQKEFIAAQEALEKATPEDMTAKFFFFHEKDPALEGCCQHTFDIGEFEEVVVKQYVEEEWVELEELGKKLEEEKAMEEEKKVVVNPDGTVTIVGLETAPTVFFTK